MQRCRSEPPEKRIAERDAFENSPFAEILSQDHVDLVQPRGETPVYSGKRATGIDKWRKGESPATTYPDAGKGAISDLGK